MSSPYENLKALGDSSCLSTKVYNIICKNGITSEIQNTAVFDENGHISWAKLEKVLPDYREDSYDYFLQCSTALAPVFCASAEFISQMSEEEFTLQYGHWLKWTTLPETVKKCFSLLKEEDTTKQALALLLMLPVLERSLGDIYLLKGKQCPSLLKDLLLTEELEELLGPTTIQLLRVLIGPAISLNLRNVSWHGFPSPGEISPSLKKWTYMVDPWSHFKCFNMMEEIQTAWKQNKKKLEILLPAIIYGYFVLQLIASLGHLYKSHFNSYTLRHREFITFPQVKLLKGVFPDMNQCVTDTMDQLFRDSAFVMKRMESYWKYAVECFKSKQYANCVVILLPQLEHGIRRIFSVANNCPERVLTAENSVLFTTFDRTLASKMLDDSENQLRYHVGDSYVTLLLDILTYPEGPRLRDRISHGETNYNTIENTDECDTVIQWEIIANHVISICTAFCLLYVPKDSKLHCVDLFQKVTRAAHIYKSVYHPISLLESQIQNNCQNLSEWKGFPRPAHEEMTTLVIWLEVFKTEEELLVSDIYKAGLKYIQYCGNLLPKAFLSILHPFQDISQQVKDLCKLNTNTLYRKDIGVETVQQNQHPDATKPNSITISKEEELIGLLRRITGESIKISEQVKECCESKYQLWKAKKLRSRQRETYKRMLDTIPTLSSGLRLVVVIVLCHLNIFTSENNEQQLQQVKYIKFLKFVLQYCENIINYTSTDKNLWEEADKFTKLLFNKCLSLE